MTTEDVMRSSAGPELQRLILIVEAEPGRDLRGAGLLFESAGFRVLSAGSFDEAKQLLKSDSPDVLLTELKLGPYNGLHLVVRSRADHPQMAAFVTSHFADTALAAEAASQNAAFLVRPFGDLDLLKAVQRAVAPARGPIAVEKQVHSS
jgi:DNA-binding NtrC family response regulator